MNDLAQASDTTSDSEFDEQDLTAEEDEDSIAPEEDVADEEEVNSLVKESQMSLEDLLASYGVPTSGLNITDSTNSNSSGRARSNRTALRRSASAATTSSTTAAEESEPIEESADSSSASPTAKRSRRSTTSPSPGPLQPKADTAQDSEQTGGTRRNASKTVAAPSLERVKELHVTTSIDPVIDGPIDSVSKLSFPGAPSSHTSSPATATLPSDSQETPSPQRSSRRCTANASEKTAVPTLGAQMSTGDPSPAPVSVTNPAGEAVPTQNTPSVAAVPIADSCPITTSELEGDESRDSTREDNYSSRFWQRVIGAGESPHSYNSDEDEDYAPSVESGHDWRGEIHVGDEHQAFVPPFHSHPSELTEWWDTRRFELESSLLWQPSKIPEQDVIRFERLFAQTVMFPLPSERTVDDEEALFMLMRCNYDPDEALQRVRFRTVSPAEIPGYMESWSEADAVAFEKGFALYNKDFKQIRDTRLRHKTVGELVHYYYLWKKSARHDEFARAYRRDRRKSPHPSMTDFMDCLVLEQEANAEAYMCHINHNGHNESNVGAFHLVNHHRLSPAHHRAESGSGHAHEPVTTSTASRYLSHPDPHHTSADFARVPNKPAAHGPAHRDPELSETAGLPISGARENGKDKANVILAATTPAAIRSSDAIISTGRGGTGAATATRAASVSV